jgi:hypothetical protein
LACSDFEEQGIEDKIKIKQSAYFADYRFGFRDVGLQYDWSRSQCDSRRFT